MTPLPSYLKQRRLGWYVQLSVPLSRQAALGCKTLTRSLQTRDPKEAERRRHRVIAELQALIETAAPQLAEDTPQGILETAREARAAVDAGTLQRKDAEHGLEAAIEDYLETQARKVGVDAEGNPRVPPEVIATINQANRLLTGNPALTVGYQAERFLSQVEASKLTRQTVGDKRRHLEAFLDWIGRDTECRRITKARASAFVDDVIVHRDVSQQTKRNAVNVPREFFDWIEARGVVNANPFAKLGRLLKDSKRGKEQARRPWQPEELLAMLEHVPEDDPLWALTALGAYTGARREDLCALEVDAASGDVLKIRSGKTAAATRRVPVHPVIRPLVRKLVATSTDGYLLPGLLTGGADAKRGHYVGKRFGYALRKAGVTDSRVVFHAFRNAVLSQMEAAGVEHSMRQQIIGHKRQSLTDDVYTAEASDARRAKAIGHVSYGKDVDALVRKVGKRIAIKHESKRRA